MTQPLHLVFGYPGPGVDDEQFHEWYEEHLDEILTTPGFRAAQRYELVPANLDPALDFPYRHVVLYEVEGDPDTILKSMQDEQLNNTDSYAQRKETDSSGPVLPAWWSQVRFLSFNAIPVGRRHEQVDPAGA